MTHIYNIITFFPIFLFLYIVHYLMCVFFSYIGVYCIPTVLFLCMSVLSCMSALSTKSGLIKTLIVHAVFIVFILKSQLSMDI